MTAEGEGSTPTKTIYCNRCQGETRHVERGVLCRHFSVDDGHNSESLTYRLWTCAGCDTGTMETEWTASYFLDEGEQQYTHTYDPPRAANHLRPKVFRKIPSKLRGIYVQTIKAFNGELYTLCAAGLRAVVEGMCASKGIKGANLAKKINGLQVYLPKPIVENLHGFRFMGNDAVHDLVTPKREDLRVALEVSEDLLNILYELDYKASLLPKKATKGPAQGGV